MTGGAGVNQSSMVGFCAGGLETCKCAAKKTIRSAGLRAAENMHCLSLRQHARVRAPVCVRVVCAGVRCVLRACYPGRTARPAPDQAQSEVVRAIVSEDSPHHRLHGMRCTGCDCPHHPGEVASRKVIHDVVLACNTQGETQARLRRDRN